MRVWNPIRLLVAGMLLVASACGDSGGGTEPEGGFTISVSAATLNLTQGGTASFNVNVTRTGDFTGPVTVMIQNLPTNVTATPNPATIGQGVSSVSIELSAAEAAAVGNSNITVRAEGGGETRTQTVELSVISPTTPTFNLAINPSTISVARGGTGTVTATLTRVGGHNAPVVFSVSGAPAGMTVAFDPNNTTGNSSTITVNVGQNVATQNHTLTINAQSGNITQTANLTVTVTGGSTGGGGNVTFLFCSPAPVVFAAVQDGTGDWQPVTVNNGTASFNITSGRGGIAWVVQTAGQYLTEYFYGTTAELNAAANANNCDTTVPEGSKTLTGSVAGLGLTESADVSVGSGSAFVTSFENTFTMNNVTDGATDAVAFRLGLNVSGGGFSQSANRGIIRRNVNYTGTVPVFDFGAAESFALTPRNLTVGNLGGDQISLLTVMFMTNRGVSGLLHMEALPSPGATRQIPTVPSAQAGDLHFVTVGAGPEEALRAAYMYFEGSADRTVNLGPVPGNVTITQVATSPSRRFRAQYTIQPEYNRMIAVTYAQQNRSIVATLTRDYLNGTSFDYTLPELTGLAGYPAAAALTAGQPVTWSLSGFNFTGDAARRDGLLMTLFIRNGTM